MPVSHQETSNIHLRNPIKVGNVSESTWDAGRSASTALREISFIKESSYVFWEKVC